VLEQWGTASPSRDGRNGKTVGYFKAGRNFAALGAALALTLAAGCSSTKSPASDPACPGAKTTAQSLDKSLNADMNKVQSDGTDGSLLVTDITNAGSDIGNAQSEISTLLTKSTNSAVKSPLQDLSSKLGQVSGDFSNSNTNIFDDLNTLIGQVKTDEAAIDTACGTGGANG
jgi:hypothetical protein